MPHQRSMLSLCNNIGAGYQHILEVRDVVHCVTSYYRSGIVFTVTSHGADPSHIDEPNLATLLREPRRQNFSAIGQFYHVRRQSDRVETTCG